MKTNLKQLALGALIGGSMALVAVTVASARTVVNPTEPMVNVAGIGPSRISTVRFCAHEAGLGDYREAITDSEVETLHSCLKENT